MKPQIIKYLLLTLVFVVFTACSHDNPNSSTTTNSKTSSTTTDNTSNLTESTSSIAPTLKNDNSFSIYEDIKAGEAVGTIVIVDSGDSNISSMALEGAGSNNFDIASDGKITVRDGAIIDYEKETSYDLKAYATNRAGDSNASSVKIVVKNIKEVPTLATTNASLPEDATAGDYVGAMKVSSEGDSEILSFQLAKKSDLFTLSEDGNVTVKEGATFDYESEKSYSLYVSATNAIGTSPDRMFHISITNIVDVKPILSDTNITVSEGAQSGDKVGDINFKERGDDKNIDITLSGEGSENFFVTTHGVIKVSDNASLDYEKVKEYSFDVNASNGAGDSNSSTLQVTLTNVENPFQIEKLQASDAEKNDYFGNSVAVSRDYIVVGAPTKDGEKKNAGSAYLYKKDKDGNVKEIAKLEASDADADDNFGESVAISGSYIIVGANREDTTADNAGSAYLFKMKSDSEVTQIAKIQADDADADDLFGSSVAIYGDYVLVSAPKEDTTATDAGSVYLFKRNSDSNVSQLSKIQASNAGANDEFGTAISLYGDYFVVGTPLEDTTDTDAGSVYLFKRNSDDNITQLKQIQSDDVEKEDYFGSSVAINKNYIAAGAYGEDTQGDNAGSGYLFKINSDDDIAQVKEFQASDADYGDNFGKSIALGGIYVIVTAPNQDIADTNNHDDIGMVYIFKRDENDDLKEMKKLQIADTQKKTLFKSLAVDENNIVVGAALGDSYVKDSGSAYLFDFEPKDKIYFYALGSQRDKIEQYDNQNVSILYAATPANNDITFSIGGDDKNDFTLNDDNNLTFKNHIDYEDPHDSGRDNNYSIKLSAKANGYSSVTQELNATVYDSYLLDRATLQASNKGAGDEYATSVAIDGEYIVAGAPYEDSTKTDAGSAYLIKKSSDGTLQEVAKIHDEDNASEDQYFSNSVSISGDYILVGAYNDGDAGAAYLFKKGSDDSLSELAKLEPSSDDNSNNSNYGGSSGSSADDKEFGTSVAIDGDYIAIGAPKDGSGDAGSAYIYKRVSDDNISLIKNIKDDNGEDGDHFGASIAIKKKVIIVGTPGKDNDSGGIYMYKINDADDDVDYEDNVTADDVQENDSFGSSISLSGDYIAVGAPFEDTAATDGGSAYLFKKENDSSLKQTAKIVLRHGVSSEYFGTSVSISGDYIAIGAPGEESSYIFKRNSDADNDVSNLGEIKAEYGGESDSFGSSIALDNSNLVIGAPKNDTDADDSGKVYLLEKDANQKDN